MALFNLSNENKKRNYICSFIIGILVGLLPFMQIHVFISMLVILSLLFLIDARKREFILIILIIEIILALPQLIFLKADVRTFLKMIGKVLFWKIRRRYWKIVTV